MVEMLEIHDLMFFIFKIKFYCLRDTENKIERQSNTFLKMYRAVFHKY